MKTLLLLFIGILSFSIIGCSYEAANSKKIYLHPGVVKFTDSKQLPRDVFHLRGNLEVEFFNDLIIIQHTSPENEEEETPTSTYVIQKESLIYMGSKEF